MVRDPLNSSLARAPFASSASGARSREWRWLTELAAETNALEATKRYRDWLKATSRHWQYSPMNCTLIHLQRPNATRVAGRRDWERRGRTLKPGAMPISVLAPGGGRRFVVVSLFDLRDTDGPELKIDGWTLAGGSRHLEKIEAAAGLLGITLVTGAGPEGASGATQPGMRVWISDGLSRAERAATLLHEYGHALLGHAEGKTHGHRIDEAEAEGIAFIVSKALGARSKAPQYLAHLGVTATELQRSFRRIAFTARNILSAIHGRRPRKRALSSAEEREQQLEPMRQLLQQALMKRSEPQSPHAPKRNVLLDAQVRRSRQNWVPPPVRIPSLVVLIRSPWLAFWNPTSGGTLSDSRGKAPPQGARSVQVTCGHCSTRYLLEDRLVGPSGALVQCTRCGFTFSIPPSGPKRGKRRGGRKTKQTTRTEGSTNLRSVAEIVLETVGSADQYTNSKAFRSLQAAAWQSERARTSAEATDGRIERIQAAHEFVTAVETTLHRRLSRIDQEERLHLLALQEEFYGKEGPRSISDRQMAKYLRAGELPSLRVLAHWLNERDAPDPIELADFVRKTLYVPPEHYSKLFDIGQVRNVLSHRSQYEIDGAGLGEAAAYLGYGHFEGEGRLIDISPENLERLRVDCVNICRGVRYV